MEPQSTGFCDDEGLLCEIFSLTHRDEYRCIKPDRVCELLSRFHDEADCGWAQQDGEGKSEDAVSTMAEVRDHILGKDSDVEIVWWLDYGCAAICVRHRGCAAVATQSYHLVGLDKWTAAFHSFPGPGHVAQHQQTAVCNGHVVLATESIDASRHHELMKHVHEIIRVAPARKKKKKQHQGHHKTPGFIASVFKDAHRVLAGKCEVAELLKSGDWTLPTGGFTDVGPHTGVNARRTCWPLVVAVHQQLAYHTSTSCAIDPDPLHRRYFAHFALWMCERQTDATVGVLMQPLELSEAPFGNCSASIDAAMIMLRSTVERAASVIDDVFGLSGFEARCAAVLKTLTESAASRRTRIAQLYRLPSDPVQVTSTHVHIAVPELSAAPQQGNGVDQARRLAEENLSWLPLLPRTASTQTTIDELLLWMSCPRLSTAGTLQVLTNIERVFFAWATLLEDPSEPTPCRDVESIETLIDKYRTEMARYRKSFDAERARGESRARLIVELFSTETLVVWIGVCLVHKVAASKHPILRNFGVAIDWRASKHLVLSQKEAFDAALHVSSYLRAQTNERPVFSLSAQSATLELATRFATADPELSKLWRDEDAAATCRTNTHWDQVQAKQQDVVRLRGILAGQQGDLRSFKHRTVHSESHYSSYQSGIRSRKQDISKTELAIIAAEEPPPALFHPLPKNAPAAMRVLFFMHMPVHFRVLSRMTIVGQQMLFPSDIKESSTVTIVDRPAIKNVDSALREDFSNHACWRKYHDGTVRSFEYGGATRQSVAAKIECFASGSIPNDIGPTSVMEYACRTDGVWHPDLLGVIMAWSGGAFRLDMRPGVQGGHFNPFSVDSDSVLANVVEGFTERDPVLDEAKCLWALPQFGNRTAPTRGNQPVASQHLKPQWLSKPQWLAFTVLRAFPNQQLRKLCAALRSDLLPLEHSATLTLVRQLLAHVGDLTDDTSPNPIWKTEQLDGSWCETMHDELARSLDILRDKPCHFRAMLLLSEVAGYVCQWYPATREIGRQFAECIGSWADNEAMRMQNSDPKYTAELQTKMCLLRMYAIACHARGELTASDATDMIRLRVQVNNSLLLQEPTEFNGEAQSAKLLCDVVMASRESELCRICQDLRCAPLTEAVRSIIEHTPSTLEWRPMQFNGSETACYEAVCTDSQHYSINISTGIVLFNGNPPGQLPHSILSDPVYMRSFGDRKFEVCLSSTGVHKTTQPIRGRVYTFEKRDDELIVCEIDPKLGTLRLLGLSARAPDGRGTDGNTGGAAAWGGCLPDRLLAMHSHWLSEDLDAIAFRGVQFHEREVDFVLLQDTSSESIDVAESDGGPGWTCLRVPHHRRATVWAEFVDTCTSTSNRIRSRPYLATKGLYPGFDRLVVYDSAVTAVLEKFEQRAFIHTYLRPAAVESSGALAVSDRVKLHIHGTGILTNPSHAEPHHADGATAMSLIFELPRYSLEFEQHSASGYLQSLNYIGMRLASCQILEDTLSGFQQYLVLETVRGGGTAKPKSKKLLLPEGALQCCLQHVQVALPEACDSKLEHYAHTVHSRFSNLEPQTQEARLQLAAMYSATSTLLPEASSGLTGCETAMLFVRQSWTNQPLTAREHQYLVQASQLCHLAPGLVLVCAELELSSSQLEFLHPQRPGLTSNFVHGSSAFVNAKAQYVGQSAPFSQRVLLNEMEEVHLLGRGWGSRHFRIGRRSPQHVGSLDVIPCPIELSYVEEEEARLCKRVHDLPLKEPSPAFLVKCSTAETPTRLDADMHNELKDSWEVHHSTPLRDLVGGLTATKDVEGHWWNIRNRRTATEEYLLDAIHRVPDAAGHLAPLFRMYRLAQVVPTVPVVELIRSVWDTGFFPTYNPFLSETARGKVRKAAILWGKLCVLEDRIGRVLSLMSSPLPSTSAIRMELENHRTWDAAQNPRWLAFEVESQVQIRPKQIVVAQAMIQGMRAGNECDRPIVQLNMGEGKTRVILPMLALHFSADGKLPRLNILSSIITEAVEHLRNVLSTPVLRVKVCATPFVRDVELNIERLAAMCSVLQYCLKSGGVLVVAPEHRQSLTLKRIECELEAKEQNDICAELDRVADLPYVDIIDESDEVLRYNTKLIYTGGNHTQLPSLDVRCVVIQAVLRVLANSSVMSLLTDNIADRSSGSKFAGGFTPLRLIPGTEFDAIKPAFLRAVASTLLNDPTPPHGLRWVAVLAQKNEGLLLQVVEYVAAPPDDSDLGELLEHEFDEGQMDAIIMLRGLLHHGLLLHCLQKRHRVDYGVNQSGRKRIAVPFHGCDTPAPRAEFSCSDVSLIFTALSYYYNGLGKGQVKAAFAMLLEQGGESQKRNYLDWLERSNDCIHADDIGKIDEIGKIDLSNSAQLNLLCRYFGGNTTTVDYFLNNIVFPDETQQFPYRLEATAWDLASNRTNEITGFSGTNDMRLLYPGRLSMVGLSSQNASETEVRARRELEGTDGKMIEMIIARASYVSVASRASSEGALLRSSALNTSVLEYVVSMITSDAETPLASGGRTTALIDAGALMAGMDTEAVARYLMDNTAKNCFRGVVFFRNAVGWQVLDRTGKIWKKSACPFTEASAFVYFDESRCRGADMKLDPDAKAVVTLGPRMCKDKFMQAAARMRQLDRDQRLTLIAPDDVEAQLSSSSFAPITPVDVLNWTLSNTSISVAEGLPEWARQGAQYCSTKGRLDLAQIPEVLELSKLYGGTVGQQSVADAWVRSKEDCQQRVGESAEWANARPVAKIERRVAAYGGELQTVQSTLDQECERELEKEIQKEIEVEAQVGKKTPRSEHDWNHSAILRGDDFSGRSIVKSTELTAMAREHIDFGTASPTFSALVFATDNFFHCCESSSAENETAGGAWKVNEYLRWVDLYLEFPSQKILLVSEREADAILGAMWLRKRSMKKPTAAVVQLKSLSSLDQTVSEHETAAKTSMRVFSGETSYHQELFGTIRAVLAQSQKLAKVIVHLRGRQASWDRSDLEEATTTYTFT